MRRFIHEIHEGRNLEKNLIKYRDTAIPLYMEYAALELTFSAFTMVQEISEEKRELAEREEAVVSEIFEALGKLGTKDVNRAPIIEQMKELRTEITDKMDLFTAYTDRMICYEYVLNRMELKFLPEEELDRQLASFDEEMYLQELLAFLFGDKDQSVVRDKLRMILGQIPVHMTKVKFFERIREALTLYRDGDRAAVDDFIYMLKTSAMVYEPKKYVGTYEGIENCIRRLSDADYKNLTENEYEELATFLEQGAKGIHEITDFYYSLQKVVNCIYAVCLIFPYWEGDTKLVGACQSIWSCLAARDYAEEMLEPLEGRIEDMVEKSSYLESVLFEIKSSCRSELETMGLTEFFEDFSLVANLLSDSLFIDLDKAVKPEKADSSYVREKTEKFIEELSGKMKSVSRPVKRAMMGQVLEKLPMVFKRSEEVEEYLRVNLLGCQDKAEKCTVMRMLRDLVRED